MKANARKFGVRVFGAAVLALILAAPSAWAGDNWKDFAATTFSTIDPSAKTISITSEAELALLAKCANDTTSPTNFSGWTITLTKNLDLSGKCWEPIGNSYRSDSSITRYFSGTFNGAGYTITGLNNVGYVPVSGAANRYCFGLFACVSGATVRNVKFANVAIDADVDDPNDSMVNSCGAVAGYNFGSGTLTISDVHVLSGTITAIDCAGGLFGRDYALSTYTRCTSAATVTSTAKAGGIVSFTSRAGDLSIEACENTGAVNGTLVAGVIGFIQTADVNLTSCTNRGAILLRTSGDSQTGAGGICGWHTANSLVVSNSLNTGAINGVNNNLAGGIVGHNACPSVLIVDCTNTGDVNGGTCGGAIACRGFGSNKVEIRNCVAKDCLVIGENAFCSGTLIVTDSDVTVEGTVQVKVGEAEPAAVATGRYIYSGSAWAAYVAPTAITMSETEKAVTVGGAAFTLTATTVPAGATYTGVAWSSDDETVATVANGTVTIVGEGTATITATSTDKYLETPVSGTCEVTVCPAIESISLDKSAVTLQKYASGGEQATLTVTFDPENVADKTITWTTANAGVATVADGVVTAAGEGSTTITATSVNGKTATCAVTVELYGGLSQVSLLEGTGYTNIQVAATSDGSATIRVTVKDGSTTVGYRDVSIETGTSTNTVAVGDIDGFEKGKTYTYEVQAVGEETVRSFVFQNLGWQTNVYFKAVANGNDTEYVNGAWTLNPPTTNETVFAVDATQTVFTVTSVKQDASHQAIVFTCTMDIDDFVDSVDLAEELPSAIGALALVTNETSGAVTWQGLVGGTAWTDLTGLAAAVGVYDVRIEADYSVGTTPKVRYSAKANGTDTWTVLKNGDAEWVDGAASAANVSQVGFVGTTDVAGFAAQLSTKAIALVGADEYLTLEEALEAAKSGKEVFLFTNVILDGNTLPAGGFTIVKNGKTYSVLPVTRLGKTSANRITQDGDTFVVEYLPLVAEIADTDRYFSLNEAVAAATAGDTVEMIANDANVAAVVDKLLTIDLAEFTIAKGTAAQPILTVDGADAQLLLTGAGAVTGATEFAAISVTNSAKLYVSSVYVTNNTAAAIAATAGGYAEVSNGWFQANGGFKTDTEDGSKILFVNGAFVDAANYVENVKAIGGYFTDEAANESLLTNATTDCFSALAAPIVTNGVTLTKAIVLATGAAAGNKVYVVENEEGEPVNVQLPDSFVTEATGLEPGAEAQEKLQEDSAFEGATKWECYVLGMPKAAKNGAAATTEGPYLNSAQDASTTTIGFQLCTPEMIKAAESGCKVEFQVEAYDDAAGTGDATVSDRVDYTKSATLTLPTSGAKYYKTRVFITPLK